jgi:hypothetical protein
MRASRRRTEPSGPIPKFVSGCGTLKYELRNRKTTSNFYDSSAGLNLKFLNELAAIMIGTSNSPH